MLHTSVHPSLQGIALPVPATPAVPPMVATWLQPKRNLPTWRARGCNVAIGHDGEKNSDGTDGVPLAMWCDAAKAAGLRYIVDASADPATDAKDPNRAGFLLAGGAEVDNVIINIQDANAGDAVKLAAAQEAYYVSLETKYAALKKAAPNVSVYLTIDVNQFQFHRPDYTRLFKACDYATGDFYPVQRAMPVTEYGRLLDLILAWPGGNKFALAWIEVCWQHLNPTYFHGLRGPTVDEWRQEVAEVVARKLSVGWFPQSMGEDGTGFVSDATDPAIAAAMTAWANPTTSPAPPPSGVGAASGSTAPVPVTPDPLVSIAHVHESGAVEWFDRRKQ